MDQSLLKKNILGTDSEVNLLILWSFHSVDSLCFLVFSSIDRLPVSVAFSFWRNSCLEIEACSGIKATLARSIYEKDFVLIVGICQMLLLLTFRF